MPTGTDKTEVAVAAMAGSLHHDISTATGEEVVLFTLDTSPVSREAKRG
jgi:uncharacterized protein YbcI